MSSLSAARADGFYNPPDWDPSKISRDKYQGSKGSNQYEQRGEIRFEMPWNIWCTTCDSHIGRGVRYNAKKTHITNYFSTKIWEFAMKCHICKGIIKICTDPQQCDYKITEGGKRQVTTYSTDDLELINVQSDAHKEKMETDPIYRLQHQEMDKKHKLQNALRLQALHSLQERDKNDYDNNCNLRRKLRAKKKRKQQLQKHADAKGFALPLLEFNEEDEQKAKHVQFKKEISAKKKLKRKRRKIENESVFNDAKGNETIKINAEKSRKLKSLHCKTAKKKHKSKATQSVLNNRKRSKEKNKAILLNRMRKAKQRNSNNAFAINLQNVNFSSK
eukprot:180382_1